MSTAIALPVQPEILGPDSPYEKGRLALRNEYAQIVEAAKELKVIESREDAERATEFGRLLQTGTKEFEKFYKEVKVQIDAIKKPVLESEKQDIGKLTAEKLRLGGLQTQWDAKVRREREEADRIAREAAEKQAREEQLARAVELEQAGDLQQAEAVLEEPVYAAPVFTQAAAPQAIAGKVSKVNYGMEVVDFMALVRAVAEGKAPQQALQANLSFLNSQAKAFKEGFAVAGCKLTKEETTHYRS